MSATVPRHELVAWYAVSGGRQIHAFIQDPDSNFFRQVPLCRPGLVASRERSTLSGNHCQQCERILRFIQHNAEKYLNQGLAKSSAEAFRKLN